MSVSVPNTFTANTKIQSAQVNSNFTAILALIPITTLGDLCYASSTTAMSRLAGNITTTQKFLAQTGNGAVSAAPGWVALVASDVGLTTKGDLLTYGSALARQAVGTDGQTLIANSAATNGIAYATPEPGLNLLANSGFDYWQRTTTPANLAGSSGSSTTQYGPDRWYVRNALAGTGTAGTLSNSRTTGSADGSKYGCQVQIQTAPIGTPQNGCELWQVLENPMTLYLYNQSAIAQFKVKALNNVTQVGIQFFYSTSEAKPTTGNNIGSEQLFTVNSSTFTVCTTTAQAMGTSSTAAGAVAVRLRITGVSSGNTYDVTNGFIAEQAGLWVVSANGTAPPRWARQGRTQAEELAYCQRFYEKSFDLDTAPGTTGAANHPLVSMISTAVTYVTIPYLVQKRAQAAPTYYNTNTGGTATFYDPINAASRTPTQQINGYRYFSFSSSASVANGPQYAAFTVDADI